MALKKLAPDIQSLFCASTQISTFKSAIEELVYNSLDADASSIAIRVNIDENSVQVIDNGIGVEKNDFKLLGQRYATSKCVHISTMKSAPNKYGFRGQSLSSIIEVSKRLNITSRCGDTEDTWTKEFYKGKEYRFDEATVRPSKGTTVDIRGFLYNLHIQKKTVNSLSELNDIKTFLQQISLVHNNKSLSLRDDSKNEIVFKLHKNRDIYQTLSSVFGVDKRDVQELKVEKNENKVTAIIAKRDKEICQYHWVYLNGKFINSSKIYKAIDGYLIKLLGLKNTKRKSKLKNIMVETEDITSKKNIPMYFIFITCPYNDYDISFKSKQSTFEFKNWEHLTKLIEKLVKFYVGDIHLKEIDIAKPIEKQANNKEDETREQVKKIMERILLSNPRKPAVSQMQNGVKGKIIKRKSKKRTAKLSVTKAKRTEKLLENNILKDNSLVHNNVLKKTAKNNQDKIILRDINEDKLNKPMKKCMKYNQNNTKKLKPKKIKERTSNLPETCNENKREKINVQKQKKKATYHVKKNQNNPKDNIKQKLIKEEKKIQIYKKALEPKKKKPVNDPILSKFKNQSDSVKQRCNFLARNVEGLMSYKKKRKRKIFVNETVQYSAVVKDNKNVSVRRKVDQILIQDFIPLPPKFNICSIDNRVIKTILKSQQDYGTLNKDILNVVPSQFSETKNVENNAYAKRYEIDDVEKNEDRKYYKTLSEVHKFTYDSHHYTSNYRPDYNTSNNNDHFEFIETRNGNKHFITKQSRDNLIVPDLKQFRNKIENGLKKYFLRAKQPRELKKSLFTNLNHSCNDSRLQDNSFTIDFTKSNGDFLNSDNCDSPEHAGLYILDKKHEIPQSNSVCGGTYTIISNTSQTCLNNGDYQSRHSSHMSLTQRTCYIRTSNEHQINLNIRNVDYLEDENEAFVLNTNKNNNIERNDINVVFVSKSQDTVTNNSEFEPLNICKTVMESNHNLQEDVNFSKRIWNDSLFNYDFSVDSMAFDRDTYAHLENIKTDVAHNSKEGFSQYFGDKNKLKEGELKTDLVYNTDAPKYNENIQQHQINLNIRNVDYLEDENEAFVLNTHNNNNIERNDINVVFVSKSQDTVKNNSELEPLNICETVMESNHNLQEDVNFSKSIWNDSLFNSDFSIDSKAFDRDTYAHLENIKTDVAHNSKEGFSQYFGDKNKLKEEELKNDVVYNTEAPKYNENIQQNKHFVLKTRPRFVPKGLSPIFVNCQSKNACDYYLEKDYYKDVIYNQFANKVLVQSEIFKPNIQHVKENKTKDINRVNERLQRDNASLVFNGESLEQAIVLRQVDSKFIAVKIKGRCYQSSDVSEYLSLFDQHAVHERIRLEKNLADYLIDEEWKSVALDDIPLKLTKEEVIYMHNYKNKLSQFGLQWTVLSNEEVKITGIPEAILGKNPRPVDVVMKAVRNLISEEIQVIKTQKGCVSLYPKSIMDLVFSEACRYAFKFGDKLSTHECMELLNSLSKCKTPFQCAHGRPVMAVLINVKTAHRRQYQIVTSKIHQFIASSFK